LPVTPKCDPPPLAWQCPSPAPASVHMPANGQNCSGSQPLGNPRQEHDYFNTPLDIGPQQPGVRQSRANVAITPSRSIRRCMPAGTRDALTRRRQGVDQDRYAARSQVHDASAEALCAEFHKPLPRKRPYMTLTGRAHAVRMTVRLSQRGRDPDVKGIRDDLDPQCHLRRWTVTCGVRSAQR